MTSSTLTTVAFADLLGRNYALASVIALTVKARRINVSTMDDHAAHAVEIVAGQKGLKTLVTRPDDGSFVIGITGFAR